MIIRFFSLLFLLFLFQSCGEKKYEQNEIINSPNEINEFLFVGMINTKPGIYKYNLKKNKYTQFWSNQKEKTIELSNSKEKKNSFFITVKDFGRSSVFPFIKDVKVYVINPQSEKAEFVEELGDGLQIYTHWEDENNFKVILNSFDKINSNYVNHREILYNSYGRKLNDRTEIYDITRQGYPQLPERKINYKSPGNEFSLETRTADSSHVYIKKDNEQKVITSTNQKINYIEWTKDFLFFSTISILPDNETLYSDNPETSELIIYSLGNDKIVKSWKGGGIKKFFIINDLLIFDTGFEENSRIIIFNYMNQKEVDEITIEGGCGLKNIPHIPDYGV